MLLFLRRFSGDYMGIYYLLSRNAVFVSLTSNYNVELSLIHKKNTFTDLIQTYLMVYYKYTYKRSVLNF